MEKSSWIALIVQVSGSLPSGGPYWGQRVDLDDEGNSGALFHPKKENQVPPKSPLAKSPVAQPIISVEKDPSSKWHLLSSRILKADWYSKQYRLRQCSDIIFMCLASSARSKNNLAHDLIWAHQPLTATPVKISRHSSHLHHDIGCCFTHLSCGRGILMFLSCLTYLKLTELDQTWLKLLNIDWCWLKLIKFWWILTNISTRRRENSIFTKYGPEYLAQKRGKTTPKQYFWKTMPSVGRGWYIHYLFWFIT